MGDEVGHVLPLRQFAGMGGRRVQHDDGGTRLQLVDEGVGDLADQAVGHRHQHHVGLGQRLFLIDARGADGGFQPLPPLIGNLDMVDLEARPVQVGGEPDPHLSAGAQQCDLRHVSVPFRFS